MIVKVLSNLEHDKVQYKTGNEVDLPDDVAKRLIEDGVVEKVASAKTVASKEEEPAHEPTSEKEETKEPVKKAASKK